MTSPREPLVVTDIVIREGSGSIHLLVDGDADDVVVDAVETAVLAALEQGHRVVIDLPVGGSVPDLLRARMGRLALRTGARERLELEEGDGRRGHLRPRS